MQGFDEEAQKREKKTKPKIRKQFLSERKDGKKVLTYQATNNINHYLLNNNLNQSRILV
jgi:hypothetical protein